jgi:adenylate cyclase class IV
MPSNIEIKARLRDFDDIRRRAEELSDAPGEIIPQEDTFFNTLQGRLKLRVLSKDEGQLIYYTRPDQEGPKRSDYHISRTSSKAWGDSWNWKWLWERRRAMPRGRQLPKV